jgi:hypothetical protein
MVFNAFRGRCAALITSLAWRRENDGLMARMMFGEITNDMPERCAAATVQASVIEAS